MISSQRTSIQLGLLAFAAVLFTSIAFADTYTLTSRIKPTESVFDGKTYLQLDSTDKLVVTATNAQLYFIDVSSATLYCDIDISGNRSDRTGKFRMQMAANAPVNINGTVNLVDNTTIASHNWSTNQGDLYFNGLITGDGGLIVAPGYLTEVHLNNTSSVNNYKGNTQIGSTDIYNNSNVTTYAGTLVLDADEQIPDVITAGSTSTGNLVLYSWTDASSRLTSTLNLNGHTETVNGLVTTDSLSVVTGTSGSKLRVGANNDTSTYSGNLQGAMQLEKIGTGTQTLSGANTYSGGTTISAGTLKLTNSATMGTGTATVASGATVEMGTNSNSTWTWGGGTINGAGTLKVTGGGELSMPLEKMQINTNGSLIVDGAKLTLTNPTTNYPGKNIYINNGGTLAFDRTTDSYAGIYFNNTLNVNFDKNGGGTLNTGDKTNNSQYINLISNSQITFTTNGGATNYITGTNGFNTHRYNLVFDVAKGTSANGVDLDVSARIWNSKGIIKNGDGTLAITGNNTDDNGYSGGTTINAGTLKLTGAGTMGTGAVSIATGATLTFADDLTQTTIANPISGAGKIVKEGTSDVYLNGKLNGNSDPAYNAFTGDMEIQGGKVSVLMNANSNYFRVNKLSGSGDLEIRLASGIGDSFLPNLTKDGFTGVISLEREGGSNGNKIHLNSQPCNGFTFVVNSGTTLYYEGSELQANVRLSGNGNSENYGALRLNHNMAGKITVMTDALMGINGSRTVSGNIASGAANGPVNLNIQANGNNTSNTFSGDISDGETSTLGLSIIRRNGTSNTSTFTFTGDLSYTGATSVAAGQTMALSGANANLVNSRAVTVNGTLTFSDYTGENAMQLNNLSGTNGVIIGTGKDLILNNDQLSQFTGSITAKDIVKDGDGTLKIYTGAAGQVDAQSLTVSSGNLDFKGYLTGSITVDANAVFSPGNSIGEATYGGGFELKDSAILLMEIGGADVESNDRLYNTADSGTLTINGMIDLVLAGASTLKGGDEFVAVLSGSNSGDDGFADNLLSKVNSYYFTDLKYVQLDDSYGDYSGKYAIKGILDTNAVPEPSTWALLALGVLVLFLRKRVRN